MAVINVGLLGYSGRMGQLISEEIVTRKNARLIAAFVRQMAPNAKNNTFLFSDPAEVFKRSEIIIDFTSADATPEFVKLAIKYGTPFMSGTTGLDAKGHKALQQASQKIPVLYAPNTSLSLAAMRELTILASRLLARLPYDVAIMDEHHRNKKDSPSGTAKTLGEAVHEGSCGKMNAVFTALRAGEIIGEHEVIFAGQGEVIRLHHSVTDRRIFARGAVEAAFWLAKQKKGFYEMNDVLGLRA